jgi:hypothetical protein
MADPKIGALSRVKLQNMAARLKAIISRQQRHILSQRRIIMCCVDTPPPFAPLDELHRFLENTRTMPQDDPAVQDAIKSVKAAIAQRRSELH